MPVFLTLGTVTFANYEIPEKINFGGAQALSVKKLVGGQRVIDAMGPDDDPIAWSGQFRGSTGLFRARFVDGMRRLGAPVPLFWSQLNYMVTIKHFKASFERFYEVPYEIECEVIQDLNNPFPVLLPVAYNDAIAAAITEAQDLAAALADKSVASALAILASTLNDIASISNASSSVIATITGPLASAMSAVQNSIGNINTSTFT